MFAPKRTWVFGQGLGLRHFICSQPVALAPHNNLPVAPVVQVVNLEFYFCMSPGLEPKVGRTSDLFAKKKNDSIVESALQRG